MLKSAKFVIEKTINPTIELYEKTKELNETIISAEIFEDINNLKNQTTSAKIVITKFKKTGDLYNYLKSSIKSNEGQAQKLMKSFELMPFEDILKEFEKKFKNELNDYSKLKDLVMGNIYSTWDFVFIAKKYRAQVPGILGVKDSENKVSAVIARGKFEENDQIYGNEYLTDDKSSIKYHLINGNHLYNRYITEDKLDVYFFETIGVNQQVFKGVYKLESIENENTFVILRKKTFSNSSKEKDKKKQINTQKKYRNKFKFGNKKGAGKSGIGRLKEESGSKAEIIVSDFLNFNNIQNKLQTSENKFHRYDVEVKDLVNLEVKNISNNKGFYLSDSQIQEFKDNNTKICLVDAQEDKELIYVSKPYNQTVELQNILSQQLELKKHAIKKYNGRIRIDSIEIGLIKPDNNLIGDLYQDFELINVLSQKQMIDYFKS